MPEKYPRNAVGPMIRRYRNQRGWTQEELAARLQLKGWDCTRSWLAKIEAQQVYVKDFELLYFGEIFLKKLEELFVVRSPRKADPRYQRRTKKN